MHVSIIFSWFVLAVGAIPYPVIGQQELVTAQSAVEAYDAGWARGVKRSPLGGVCLDDHVLLENDAAGAGWSQRGEFMEPLHRGVLVKKLFELGDDVSCFRAHAVLFMRKVGSSPGHVPYWVAVNGERLAGPQPSWHEPAWRWIAIPPSVLRPGGNEVVVGCDAPEGEGYELLFAREDEYAGGGGKFTYGGNTALVGAGQVDTSSSDPLLRRIAVGSTSWKSVDGGKTWTGGLLGAGDSTAGEYTVRLNMERYVPGGHVSSPVIDLWAGDDGALLVPRSRIGDLRFSGEAFVPGGTDVVWSIRFSSDGDPLGSGWGAWREVGRGGSPSVDLGSGEGRYLQWRADLRTSNPLLTPVVRRVSVGRKVQRESGSISGDYHVVGGSNARMLYPAYRIGYEDPGHPELRRLVSRLGLDSVVAGARGDFERINRVRHFVSGLWPYELPAKEYPEWNANSVLDRRDRLGAGGMCMQYTMVFMQALQALGYTVRHTNVFAHETTEVYVDELGKWVQVDPESTFNSYQYHTETGEPLNTLEQHGFFLKELGFSAERPIDWTSPVPWAWTAITPWVYRVKGLEHFPQPLGFSSFTAKDYTSDNPPPQHALTGFLRFIPRNDFLSRPMPRPVNHGLFIEWPWNGYINWYDAATPRKLQYALHSDREADFYPTLNRVRYSATHGERDGEVTVRMATNTPNFERYEINVDGQGWTASAAEFTWRLRPSALNTLEMRVVNASGIHGYPSDLRVLWHYREPHRPLKEKH